MTKYKESDICFINPYNFVPVNLKQTERGDITEQKEEELFTGYLQCHIRCRTPLAVPDAENKEELTEKHYKYPFFTVDGQPVIPGSTIRGVIRNVYETITDSCFGSMQEEAAITARSSKPFMPGVLKREGDRWKLYQAKRWLVVVDKKFYSNKELASKGIICYENLRRTHKTGDEVYFGVALDDNEDEVIYEHEDKRRRKTWNVGAYVTEIKDTEDRKCKRMGYLCLGERAPKRHFQSVFELGEPVEDVEIGETELKRLEDILNEYRDEKKNKLYKKGHNGYPDYEEAKEKGVIPVYYLMKDGLYMTFAALGRKAYKRSWDDITFEKSHRKCNGRKHLCPACMLFGTAQGDKLGSRIRFTDAVCENDSEESYIRDVTFEELGSPRMSYLPFYLREVESEADYAEGYDSEMLEIRGRKFYWHHEPDVGKNCKRNERNATFDVIRKNTKFEYKIYFDGITMGQLELLEMAVHLNDNNLEGNMCHKMGHGKPLGYGSVKMTVESCKVRIFSLEDGWKEEPKEIPCAVTASACTKETMEALKIICNFDTVKNFDTAKVEYPEVLAGMYKGNDLTKNDLANHQWFTQNYKLGSKSPKRKLPQIKDTDLTLKKYVVIKK